MPGTGVTKTERLPQSTRRAHLVEQHGVLEHLVDVRVRRAGHSRSSYGRLPRTSALTSTPARSQSFSSDTYTLTLTAVAAFNAFRFLGRRRSAKDSTRASKSAICGRNSRIKSLHSVREMTPITNRCMRPCACL